MKCLASNDSLKLPMKSNYVDNELWLSAVEAETKGRRNARELRETAERNGMETICSDAVTASILLADWLSINDWPIPASAAECPEGEPNEVELDLGSELEGKNAIPKIPYRWKEFLTEDSWIYENIHAKSFDDLRVEHSEKCQSQKHFKKVLSRRAYWDRADRFAKYHGLPKRRFKGRCCCRDCQTVTDSPLTGD